MDVKGLLALGLWLALAGLALAQSAVLLPNGRQQFLDANGSPLAGGSVFFYVPPATTTPKTTWSDAGATTPNTNPVTLGSSGEALIYGNGTYRQVVKDALGNTVWDAQTSGLVGPWPAYGGVSTGSANAQVVSASSWAATGGAQLVFKAGFDNSGATTLTIGALGTFSVVKDGVSGPVALSSGDIQLDNLVLVTYDSVAGNLHMTPVPFALPSVLPIAQGGTGNSTAAGARGPSGLNIDEMTTHGDSAYVMVPTDRTVATSAVLTAPRTWTLPVAATVNAGQRVLVTDKAGGIAGANVLVVARGSSGDSINGLGSVSITSQFGALEFVSDGVTKWTSTTPVSSVITPWVAYVPTFTGFGAATNLGTWSRRVGSNLEVMSTFTAGVNTATEARMSLGFNGTNGNVTTATLPTRFTVGVMSFDTNFAGYGVVLAEAGVGYLNFGEGSATVGRNSWQKALGTFFLDAITLSFQASVPVAGW